MVAQFYDLVSQTQVEEAEPQHSSLCFLATDTLCPAAPSTCLSAFLDQDKKCTQVMSQNKLLLKLPFFRQFVAAGESAIQIHFRDSSTQEAEETSLQFQAILVYIASSSTVRELHSRGTVFQTNKQTKNQTVNNYTCSIYYFYVCERQKWLTIIQKSILLSEKKGQAQYIIPLNAYQVWSQLRAEERRERKKGHILTN